MKEQVFAGIKLSPSERRPEVYASQNMACAHTAGYTKSIENWIPCRTQGIATLEEAIARLCEGGFVCDKRNLPTEMAVLCISGPGLDITLPPMSGKKVLEDTVHTLSSIEEAPDYYYLSLDLYCEWWRLRGAKVGRKVRGKVRWQDVCKLVMLESLSTRERFFSDNLPSPHLMQDGSVGYRVLGYADTVEQAQKFLSNER